MTGTDIKIEKVHAGTQSCIYTGHVRHRRLIPVKNEFRYRIFLMYVDLDELPHLFDGMRLWSFERKNLASFHRRYYFGDEQTPLAAAVKSAVHEKLGLELTGPVRMLTHFRYMGYCYNPVTFYYCFDSSGSQVQAIVAEITNTPWGERFAYILDCRKNETQIDGRFRWTFPKTFHVSPFMPMNVLYNWRFTTPGETLNIHMADNIKGEKYFDATLTLQRRDITQSMLNRVLLSYPLMTTKVVVAINWQAFRLWLKRTPYYKHPCLREQGNRQTITGDDYD